jgi:heme-degrading monooxygenase HmoA
MREQWGFRGGLVLSNTEVDEGYTLTIWETEVDAEAYESSGVYQEQVAKVGNLLVEPPTRKIYEVSVQM